MISDFCGAGPIWLGAWRLYTTEWRERVEREAPFQRMSPKLGTGHLEQQVEKTCCTVSRNKPLHRSQLPTGVIILVDAERVQ
jgi:hypothetical protein